MKKHFVTRLLAIVLCVAMLATVTPIVSLAGESYEVTVLDTVVETANLGDVLSDGGSVSYDQYTKTLTLNNATLTSGIARLIDINETGTVTIHLVGKNTITGTSTDWSTFTGIYFGSQTNRVYFDGDGSLSISMNSSNSGIVAGIYSTAAVVDIMDSVSISSVVSNTGTANDYNYGLYSGNTVSLSTSGSLSFTAQEAALESYGIRGLDYQIGIDGRQCPGNTIEMWGFDGATNYNLVYLQQGYTVATANGDDGYAENTYENLMDDGTDSYCGVKLTAPNLAGGHKLLVGGVWVSPVNAQDVLGDGTVEFDAETNVLSLADATINKAVYCSESNAVDALYSNRPITLNLTGSNVIDFSGSSFSGYVVGIDLYYEMYSAAEYPPVTTGDGDLYLYSGESTTSDSYAFYLSTGDAVFNSTGNISFISGAAYEDSIPFHATSGKCVFAGTAKDNMVELRSAKILSKVPYVGFKGTYEYLDAEGDMATVPDANVSAGNAVNAITPPSGAKALLLTSNGEKVPAKSSKTITEITITNADITPVAGDSTSDHLAYTLPENCHYSVTEHYWYDDDVGSKFYDTFVEGTRYSLNWEIIVDEGYEFDSNATITINGSTTVLDTDNTGLHSDGFDIWTLPTVAEKKVNTITEITITGADLTPVLGEKAGDHLAYTLAEDSHVTVLGHFWYDRSRGAVMDNTATFEAGRKYNTLFWLEPEEGYVFASDMTVTVNGGTEFTSANPSNTRFNIFTSIIEVKSPEPTVVTLNEIEITGADIIPVLGDKAGDHIAYTLPENAHYTCTHAGWFDVLGGKVMDANDVFEAEKVYCMFWNFTANEGYEFAENAAIMLNGGTEDLNAEYCYLDKTGEPFYVVSANGVRAEDGSDSVTLDLQIGGKEYYNVTDNQTIEVESLDDLKHIKVLVQDGVDIEGMSEDWSMSTDFLDNQNRGVLEVQVFEEAETYVIFNLQSHYADCPGADVPDFQVMMITAKLPSAAVYGDANGDGAVNMKDVLALRKYLAGLPTAFVEANADVNGDGSVNMKDVLALRKFLAGLVTELKVR